jgi:phosphoribosylformimino-5-aminoimidazole carboxamide ribotide isomerase
MIQIIPAIDIIEGRCVRLKQGDFSKKTEYGDDPLDIARKFEDHGISRLHLVDLDGARAGQVINYRVLERIASGTGLSIDFGGGIRTEDDINIAFNSGAGAITGGSIAVKQKALFLAWLNKFGPEKIFLGADFRDEHIAVSGWEEKTPVKLSEFLTDYFKSGIRTSICTDISRDGMLEGPSTVIYKKIKEVIPELFLVASGGISGMEDIAGLDEAGIDGVIFGKAIYEGLISLSELERYIIKNI